MDYMKSIHPSYRIFIVHRLDRDTSGVMIFAKSKEIQETLQHHWHSIVPKRAYIALVEGAVQKKAGTITSWLKENKAFIMYSSKKTNDGQKAITHYKMLKKNKKTYLLEVHLDNRHKKQIKIHIKEI